MYVFNYLIEHFPETFQTDEYELELGFKCISFICINFSESVMVFPASATLSSSQTERKVTKILSLLQTFKQVVFCSTNYAFA